MNEKQKYQSGIYGRAEARFGGKIAIEPVRFTNGDGAERHGLILSEFYNGSEVGSPLLLNSSFNAIVPSILDKKRRGTPIDDASPVMRQYARDKALQVTTCGTSAAVVL